MDGTSEALPKAEAEAPAGILVPMVQADDVGAGLVGEEVQVVGKGWRVADGPLNADIDDVMKRGCYVRKRRR